MINHGLLISLLLIYTLLCKGDEFIIDAESGMMTIPKTCLHVCKQGACLYNGCEDTKCPGGACHFVDCTRPSCGGNVGSTTSLTTSTHLCASNFIERCDLGGACVFERCTGATCTGGRYYYTDFAVLHVFYSYLSPLSAVLSCTYRDPKETLKAGYCDGGNCNIEGRPHPDLHSHLTI